MTADFRVGPPDDPDRILLGPAAASGSEGVLYRGTMTIESGVVQLAVKMLQPGHLTRLPEWTALWRDQVTLLRDVQVPGLVRVRGGFVGPLPHLPGRADRGSSTLYLLMDWIDGVSLDRWARTLENPQPEQLLRALVPVASALDLLHSGVGPGQSPMVHRDVKPANILVQPDGSTVLVDIGNLGNVTVDPRRAGVVGTPGYIAPEVRSEGLYSPAADRYSLGAVAYFLLVGEEPPLNSNSYELLGRLLVAPIVDGRREVAEHVLAMLDPVPENRPTFLANWVAQLRRSSLVSLPGEATLPPRAPSRNPPATVGGGDGREEPDERADTPEPPARSPIPGVRVGAAVLVLLLVASVAVYRRQSANARTGHLDALPAAGAVSSAEPLAGLIPETSVAATTTTALSPPDRVIGSSAPPPPSRQTAPTTEISVAAAPALPLVASDLRGTIAFVRTSEARDASKIYVMNPDGSGQRVWAETYSAGYLQWSPDGTRLAFSDNYDIRILSTDGNPPRKVTSDTSGNVSPTWSPDGSKIAFSGSKNNEQGIFVISADGGGSSQRIAGEQSYDPSWSPDGRRLAIVTSSASGPSELQTVNPDGSGSATIATGYLSDPAWSPDGRAIAFREGSDIRVVNADGSGIRRVASWPGTIPSPENGDPTEPTWSPDGMKLAMAVHKRNRICTIVTIGADGTGKQELTGPTGCDVSPAWNPLR